MPASSIQPSLLLALADVEVCFLKVFVAAILLVKDGPSVLLQHASWHWASWIRHECCFVQYSARTRQEPFVFLCPLAGIVSVFFFRGLVSSVERDIYL